MKNRFIKIVLIFTLISSVGFVSCSLDPELTENVDFDKKPISNDAELRAASIGTYSLLKASTYYGNNLIAFSEVRSDNAYSNGNTNRLANVSSFTLNATTAYNVSLWKQIYGVVSSTNRVIEANYPSMGKEADTYKGEAYVLRALAHYDALRNFGEQYVGNKGFVAKGVPYIKKYADLDAKVKRETVGVNRTEIYADLDKGIELLKNSSSQNKVKITLAAAYGIKARVALFFSNWDRQDLVIAREYAELAMKQSGGGIITRSGFKGSYSADEPQSNSIFEIKFSGVDNPSSNSLFNVYSITENGGYGPIVVNFKVAELFGSDAPVSTNAGLISNDIRADVGMINNTLYGWLQNIGKYISMTSNIKVMRYEEMVLTFIEADYRLNNGATAKGLSYYNELRKNRLTTYTNAASISLEDIRIERQKELLFEGFGFEDAMRFHRPIVNTTIQGGRVEYGSPLLTFPIPQNEINVSNIEQNEGYSGTKK